MTMLPQDIGPSHTLTSPLAELSRVCNKRVPRAVNFALQGGSPNTL